MLVAGNTRIGEAVLKLRTEGDLLSLTGGKPLGSNGVRECAAEIAANNMRKLLPPSQRTRLAEFRVEEALRIGENTLEGSLLKHLKEVFFEVNQAPTGANTMSLAEFITLDKYQHKDQYLIITYWLGGTPRQALDYARILSELAQDNTKYINPVKLDEQSKNEHNNRLLIALLEEIRRQAMEEWRLTYAQRERLAEMLDISVNISLNLESHLRVSAKLTMRKLKSFEHGNLICYISDSINVSIVDEDGFSTAAPSVNNIYNFSSTNVERDLNIKSDSAVNRQLKTEEKLVEVPRRLSSGLLFAHDFAVSLWGGYLQHGSLAYSSENIGARVDAMWGFGSDKLIAVTWNPPHWWTFRDIDRFNKHWSLHVGQCEGQYGSAWLAATLEVILNEPCQPGPIGLMKERLNGLLKGLVDEKPIRTARQVLREATLYNIALLFAPEFKSGLNVPEFQETGFFEVIEVDVIKSRIREARAYLWQQAWKQDALNTPQKFALCAAIAPGLLWKRIMELIKPMLIPLNMQSIAEIPNLLQAPKSATEAFTILKQLRAARTSISDDHNMEEFDEPMGKAEDVFESMRTSDFFLLKDGAFVPTEEDIKRVQQ